LNQLLDLHQRFLVEAALVLELIALLI